MKLKKWVRLEHFEDQFHFRAIWLKLCAKMGKFAKNIIIFILPLIFNFLPNIKCFDRVHSINSPVEDLNPYRHTEILDSEGKYRLEWEVNWSSETIVFNVSVNTRGYVGFGLAKKGKMSGADIVMGGVGENGKVYFSDRHAIRNQQPEVDKSQDWSLLDAWERDSITFLSFSRKIDTCDEDHDLPITNDVMTLIWAYGETDNQSEYHFHHRGAFPVYLLDPHLAPRNLEEFRRNGQGSSNVKIFNITQTRWTPPGQDTQYLCTFFKTPTSTKQHIIGFNTVLPTELDRKHVHHLVLHRCKPPPGVRAVDFFGDAERSEGTECYIFSREHPLPVSYCSDRVHVWGPGGKPLFFPEHTGMPMSPNGDEYFMLQTHYDTPTNVSVEITIALEVYYTDKLRKYDAGLISIGVGQPGGPTIIVPPSTLNHNIYAHCSTPCLSRMIPNGAKVFSVFQHTHLTGVGMRTRHFRNGKEMPFIQSDNNYIFNYQQFRQLRKEREILPGDFIVQHCNYQSTERNNSVVTGGFSTREEMCSTLFYYYSETTTGVVVCRSEIMDRRYWDFLRIGNITWNQSIRQNVLTAPPQFAGTPLRDHLNKNVKWNLRTREQLQQFQTYLPHLNQCPKAHYEDPQEQIREQLKPGGIFERTGTLPGSDGKAYLSVDEDFQFISEMPEFTYETPRQCSRK